MNTKPKVKAAAISGGFGVAVGTIVLYFAEQSLGDFPTTVDGAVLTVVAGVCAWAGGYLKRDNDAG